MASTTTNDPWTLPELTRARRAIVVVDVVESVRLMQEDEAGFIERWRRFVHQVRHEVLPKHGGRMVKSLGDGMLLEFEQACAAATATLLCRELAATSAIPLRTGMHVADVMEDELDIYGTGVNLAARMASLGSHGDITITAAARDDIIDGVDATVADLGECWLKHVEQPVRAFRLAPAPVAAGLPAPQPIQVGVAVMPLVCVSGAAEDFALGHFVADALIAGLSQCADLRVYSRLSTAGLGSRSLSAQEVGRITAAAYVVAGSVAVFDGRVVMALELADARDGIVLQSLRVPSPLGGLFEHPSEPIQGAVITLQRAIIDREARAAASRPLPSLASYTLLAGSIGLMHRTDPKDFDRAPNALTALIERVPRHGSAYAWMAKWHLLRMIRGKTDAPARDRADARQFIDQSLERDEHQATAWALKGLVNAFDGHDLQRAEECYQAALYENPNEALAWLYMGTLRSWQGRGAEAGEAARRALALTPLDPMRYYFESLAAAAVLAEGSHEAAIGLARNSLRVNARHTPTYRVLTIACALAGQEQQAREAMSAMRALEPDLTAREYFDRYPGRDAPHARLYVDALRAAGLPD